MGHFFANMAKKRPTLVRYLPVMHRVDDIHRASADMSTLMPLRLRDASNKEGVLFLRRAHHAVRIDGHMQLSHAPDKRSLEVAYVELRPLAVSAILHEQELIARDVFAGLKAPKGLMISRWYIVTPQLPLLRT